MSDTPSNTATNTATNTIEIPIDEDLLHQLEATAQANGISLNDYIVQLLERYLAQIDLTELEDQELEAEQATPDEPQ